MDTLPQQGRDGPIGRTHPDSGRDFFSKCPLAVHHGVVIVPIGLYLAMKSFGAGTSAEFDGRGPAWTPSREPLAISRAVQDDLPASRRRDGPTVILSAEGA